MDIGGYVGWHFTTFLTFSTFYDIRKSGSQKVRKSLMLKRSAALPTSLMSFFKRLDTVGHGQNKLKRYLSINATWSGQGRAKSVWLPKIFWVQVQVGLFFTFYSHIELNALACLCVGFYCIVCLSQTWRGFGVFLWIISTTCSFSFCLIFFWIFLCCVSVPPALSLFPQFFSNVFVLCISTTCCLQ